jgi:hypothetical protein
MRKEIFVALCAIGLLVGWVSMASATTVTWTIMQDASMAGKGPGSDLLLGTVGDTTTGQNNSCNLSGAGNCVSGVTPGTGSWSFLALELPQATSCNGGTAPGDPCGTNADCGTGGICLTCPDNPSGPDTFSYMGNFAGIGCALGNGTLKACQENGVFKWLDLKIGASESVAAGAGGTSVNLNPIGSSSGYASGCGTAASWTSTANIGFWVGCNPALGIGGTINGLNLNGRVYPATGANSATNCGYNVTDLNALRATAAGKGAAYLLVMCGTTNIPNTTGTTSACLRGATAQNVVVATTGANASICTDANPGCVAAGSCAGGVEEAAE